MTIRTVPLANEPPRPLPVTTRTGATLHALVYEPEGPIHGNVLIHAATGCPQRFFTRVSRAFSPTLACASSPMTTAGSANRVHVRCALRL